MFSVHAKLVANSNVANRVGKFYRQRFLGRLSLVVVKGLLVRGVVRSRLVRRLGNDEGIAGCVDCR